MEWEHVKWDRGLIFVPRKSRKSKRYVPLSGRVKAALLSRKTDPNERWVFLSARSSSGHIETVQKQFHRAKKLAGLPEAVVLYCARHRFSPTRWMEQATSSPCWMRWATARWT